MTPAKMSFVIVAELGMRPKKVSLLNVSFSAATATDNETETHGTMGSPIPNNLLFCRPRNDGPYDGPITPLTLHCWPGLSLFGLRGAAC